MTVGFDVAAAKSALGPLNPQAERLTDPALCAYARYYGIDFEDRIPGVRHALGTLPTGLFDIAVHVFQPEAPRGTVLVVHGYYDHVGLYKYLIEYLLNKGYTVVAYDLPGHGLSSGKRSSIRDFSLYADVLKSVLKWLRGELVEPWHVIGQSTGGAIVMDYLLTEGFDADNRPFQQVILMAPLVRPVDWVLGKIRYLLASPFISWKAREHTMSAANAAFLKFREKLDPLQDHTLPLEWVGALSRWINKFEARAPVKLPVKIVQGLKDTTVDWKRNLASIRAKFHNPDIVLIPKGRHLLMNESEVLRQELFKQLDRWLA